MVRRHWSRRDAEFTVASLGGVAVSVADLDSPVVGTISGTGEGRTDGEFAISGLPAGDYYVRVEPLVGTTNPFVQKATFANAKLKIFGSGFVCGPVRCEVNGVAVEGLKCPKKSMAPNGIATAFLSSDPNLASHGSRRSSLRWRPAQPTCAGGRRSRCALEAGAAGESM